MAVIADATAEARKAAAVVAEVTHIDSQHCRRVAERRRSN